MNVPILSFILILKLTTQAIPKIGGIIDFLELQGCKKLFVQGLDESVTFFNSLDKLKDKKLFFE